MNDVQSYGNQIQDRPYTCVARDAQGAHVCVHAPHLEIPPGTQVWVDESPRAAARNLVSYHAECVAGFWFVTQDGRKVSPLYRTRELAELWVQQHQPHSNDYAYRYGGYALVQENADHVTGKGE